MTDKPRTVGLVLARGGSKGVRGKNRKIIAGRPLLSWVLKPMLHCKLIDEVWVSTDDEATAEIARQDGVNVFMRGERCASDDATSISAIDEFLKSQKQKFDCVALVQCTSPCLQPCYLEDGIQLILNNTYDSVFSVSRDFKWRWTELGSDGTTRPLNFDPASRMCRQQWSGEIVETGHFYITRTVLVARDGLLQGGRCGFVEIPPHLCLEVDSDEDVALAELRLQKHGYKSQESDVVLDAPTEFQ